MNQVMEVENLMICCRCMSNVSTSLKKLKQLREETTFWSSIDHDLSKTTNKKTGVFDMRVQTADPNAFKVTLHRHDLIGACRNLQQEAKVLNQT
jgi:hypothetical protein